MASPIGRRLRGRRVPCSVSFTPSLIERLDAVAVRAGTSRSWVLEQVLAGWLSHHEPEAEQEVDALDATVRVRTRPARARQPVAAAP